MHRRLQVLATFLLLFSLPALADDLTTYNLKRGMPYSQAKNILEKNGWEPLLDEDAGKASPQYPEISCGNGKDAVCSAGFKNKGKFAAFVVKPSGKSEFVIESTY